MALIFISPCKLGGGGGGVSGIPVFSSSIRMSAQPSVHYILVSAFYLAKFIRRQTLHCQGCGGAGYLMYTRLIVSSPCSREQM